MHHDAMTAGFIVRTTLTLLGLILAWRFMVLPTMHDRFRQRLFEIRRSLFLLVADGKVGSTEPAYRQLRDMINGLLRFAERVTLIRALVTNKSLPLNIAAYTERTQLAMAQVKDASVRHALEEHRERVGFEIIKHIIWTSPELWIPLSALLVAAVGRAAVKAWLKKHPPIGIEAEAECFSDGAIAA